MLAQVANVKHILEMHGIECRIEGEHRSGVGAVIGSAEARAELWVDDPADVEHPQELVEEAL